MARRYSSGASRKVERVMEERKRGTLRSGSSGKQVTSRRQAIAIGLSEARRAGEKVPPKTAKKSAQKSAQTSTRGPARKSAARKSARSATRKSAGGAARGRRKAATGRRSARRGRPRRSS
jgi:hypothetical protein